MSKTITKTTVQKDMHRAEELMRHYAQAQDNRKALLDTIKAELDAYNATMKQAEEELLAIGDRNRASFNEEGNLVFDHGYLHIAENAVIDLGRNFSLPVFANEYPEMVDVKLKLALVKKAFINEDERKNLTKLGVKLDTVQKMEVKVSKS
jgi:hypothetical protein